MKTDREKDELNVAVAQKLNGDVIQYTRNTDDALTLVSDPELKFRLERIGKEILEGGVFVWKAVVRGVTRLDLDPAVAIVEAWLAYQDDADNGEWTEMESSNIAAMKYENGDLLVRFNNGGVYKYMNVPGDVVVEFKMSESAGKFLNSTIKKYDCEKVEVSD
ncbi:MAG: KTSC domain-containing protein [Planctomycetes bacterium]|nr:KTSC domain-containing protein [Planctomycetota bacterium]